MSILKYFRRNRFDDLPEVSVPSAQVSDEDTEAWGDIIYMRSLVDDIVALARQTHGAGRIVASILARPTIDDQDVDIQFDDPVAAYLINWRSYLSEDKLEIAYWLIAHSSRNRAWLNKAVA